MESTSKNSLGVTTDLPPSSQIETQASHGSFPPIAPFSTALEQTSPANTEEEHSEAGHIRNDELDTKQDSKLEEKNGAEEQRLHEDEAKHFPRQNYNSLQGRNEEVVSHRARHSAPQHGCEHDSAALTDSHSENSRVEAAVAAQLSPHVTQAATVSPCQLHDLTPYQQQNDVVATSAPTAGGATGLLQREGATSKTSRRLATHVTFSEEHCQQNSQQHGLCHANQK